MRRDKFIDLLKSDRQRAIRFLAGECFLTLDERGLSDYLLNLHDGTDPPNYVPFHTLTDERLLQIADDTMVWDFS